MSRERWQEFIVDENQDGTLQYLAKADDQNGMNWIGGEHFWGSVICPEGIEIKRKHNVLPNGNLQENIEFLNVTDFPIFFSNTDIGIYTPFNDDYKNVSVSMQKRCHTHIFCGQEASYIMALRMGEERLGLGLAITKGSIIGYSTERMITIKNKMEELSDDRGDFILHPSCECLEPGEKMTLSGQFFWFHTMEEFEEKLLDISGFPLVKAEQMTWFVGENIEFDVSVNCSETKDGEDKTEIYIDNQEVAVTEISTGQIKKVHCSYPVSRDGEYRFRIQTCGRVTEALFYGCVELDRLIRNRCQFIVEKQQYHCKGSHLDGAYLIYDNEEKKQYYSHMRNDHNGARERVGMGALIALWLQKEYDAELMNSLQKYVEYLYREIYDTTTGIVSNDIEHNLELHRMYNYPWMAILQMELYNLTKESKWLEDAGKTMIRYYKEGGTSFYAIGIPVQEIFENMQKEKMEAAQELKKWFLCQADIICKNSTQYPPFEVTFEQSIEAGTIFHPTQYMNSFGGGWKDGKEINSEANAAGLSYIFKMFDEGLAISAKEAGLNWDGEVFAAGKCAMTTGGTWYVNLMREAAPDTNYTFVPVPGGNGEKGCTLHSYGIAVVNNTPDVEMAADVAYYMSRQEAQESRAELIGDRPAIMEALPVFRELNPQLVVMDDYIDTATSFGYPANQEFKTDFTTALENHIYNGDTTSAQEVLDQLAATYGTN